MNINRLLSLCCCFLSLPAAAAILTIQISGEGKVVPDLNGRDLQIGKVYTFKEVPARGYVFANWTGTLETSKPVFHLLMVSNFVLQANFLPNPFIPRKAKYFGVFTDTNTLSGTSSGFITLNLTGNGAYSGSLVNLSNRYTFSGKFDVLGASAVKAKKTGLPDLQLALQLDLGTNAPFISGTVSNGWVAEFTLSRAGFNAKTNPAVSLAGRYTFVMPSGLLTNSSFAPNQAAVGDGYGTVTISKAGGAQVHGVLADGAKFSQSVSVNANGEWPLFISLGKGAEVLIGSLAFEQNTNGAVSLAGEAIWMARPGLNRLFPAGFTNLLSVVGNRYIPPRHAPILNMVFGSVTLQGGGIPLPVTNLFALKPNNTIIDDGLYHLVLTFTAGSGLFHGHIRPPGFPTAVPFQGAVLQDLDFGSGFYMTTNVTGRVTVESLANPVAPLTVGIDAQTLSSNPGVPVELDAVFNEDVTSSYWDFGDGTQAFDSPSVIHSWAADGAYPVTLTAFSLASPEGVSTQVIMQISDPVVSAIPAAALAPGAGRK